MHHILIVDDEERFLRNLETGLGVHANEFSVATAFNGQQALDMLKQRNVDLVITDLKMPVMDGFELLTHMSASFPHVPAIVMTAFGNSDIEERVRDLGAVRYVEKPVDLEQLEHMIFDTLSLGASGYLEGITLTTFLQIVEMEGKTCTISVTHGGRTGLIFFLEGVLLDASCGEMAGDAALRELVSWKAPTISINDRCPKRDRHILQNVRELLGAARTRPADHAAPSASVAAGRRIERPLSHASHGTLTAESLSWTLLPLKVVFAAVHSEENGEVVIRQGNKAGRVFLSAGRVAWVVSSAIGMTFSRYLTEHAGLNADELQAVYGEAKRAQKNFGEVLIEWGLISKDELRQRLLDYTAIALLDVLSWPASEAMFIPDAKVFRGTLLFDLPELLRTAMALDSDVRLPFTGQRTAAGSLTLTTGAADLCLGDLLAVCHLTRASALLTMKQDPAAAICIDRGRVIDARAGELSGEAAFVDLCRRVDAPAQARAPTDAQLGEPTITIDVLRLLFGAAEEEKVSAATETQQTRTETTPQTETRNQTSIETLTTTGQKENAMVDVAKLNAAVDYLKQQLGEGMLAADIYLTVDGQSVAGYNSNPKACALFNQVTQFLTSTLSRSGFPNLSRYYVLDLVDNKMVVVAPIGAYQWGMLVDSKKATMGLLLNVVLPEALAMAAAAIK